MKLVSSLVTLFFIAAGFFVSVPTTAEAQVGGARTNFCQNITTGQIYRYPASGNCPAGYKPGSVPRTTHSSLCVGPATDFIVSVPEEGETAAAPLVCPTGSSLQPLATLPTSTTNPTPGTPAPPGSPPPGQQQPSSPTPAPSGSQGSCANGFTQKGPLCVPNNPFSGNQGIAGQGTLGGLVTQIISILLGLAGIVAVIFVIIGGYYYMTARGDETQAANGRKTLVNALIGLAIVVLSYLIVQIVTSFIITGN
jgi:type IV secretory pathway VirB2 component (pilin)